MPLNFKWLKLFTLIPGRQNQWRWEPILLQTESPIQNGKLKNSLNFVEQTYLIDIFHEMAGTKLLHLQRHADFDILNVHMAPGP